MLVNVAAIPTSLQVTVTLWVVTVLHPGALGSTVAEIVTGPGVAGQVNVGFSMFGSSNVPAVAVQVYETGRGRAEPFAASEIGVLTEVSSGDTLSELRVAQTWVVPVTMIEPSPGAAAEQLNWTLTGVVASAETANPAEPEQL